MNSIGFGITLGLLVFWVIPETFRVVLNWLPSSPSPQPVYLGSHLVNIYLHQHL